VSITTNYNDGIYINQNLILSTGFEYDTDNGGISGTVGFTRTENTTDLPLLRSSIRSLSVDYDRTSDPRFMVVNLFRTLSTGGVLSRGAQLNSIPIGEQNLPRTVLIPIVQDVVSNAYSGRLDAWKQLEELKISAGLYATQRDIVGNNLSVGGVVPLAPLGFNTNDYVTDRPWTTRVPLGVSVNYIDTQRQNADLQAAFAGAAQIAMVQSVSARACHALPAGK
jgi:hypothetical protein